jgi:hypothetical protein
LLSISDEQYAFHATDERNDFASWLEYILHEPLLAAKLKKAKSRKDAVRLLGVKK